MKNKDLIYNTLLELQSDDGIDTSTLSNLTNISRTNVSHELNCLCKEGKIYKTSSRPVKFFINSPKIKKHINYIPIIYYIFPILLLGRNNNSFYNNKQINYSTS